MKIRAPFLICCILVSYYFVAAEEKSAQKQDKKQPQSQTQPQTIPTVNYEILQQGTYSGLKEPVAKVITSQKEWEEIWKKHVSVLVPQPPLPEVDFNSLVLAVIYSGEKRTSGYQIVLKEAVHEGSNVVVRYRETEPPPNSFTLQVLTQPFLILKIEKPTGSVQLVKQ